jgi:hypothetical protein
MNANNLPVIIKESIDGLEATEEVKQELRLRIAVLADDQWNAGYDEGMKDCGHEV